MWFQTNVTGSAIDQAYYKEREPWTMDGEKVQVIDNNDDLGQIIGNQQEEKNLDIRVQKARNSLFSLLGPAFAYKCLISPAVKLHLFRTYACPILRSGLSTFSLRKNQLYPIGVFQRKGLKSFLHLSKMAATPAIHFLTGELPIKCKIHCDVYALFYSLWTNPDCKIFEVVRYLLQTSPSSSRTWSIHLRNLSNMYGIEDPLNMYFKILLRFLRTSTQVLKAGKICFAFFVFLCFLCFHIFLCFYIFFSVFTFLGFYDFFMFLYFLAFVFLLYFAFLY